MAGQGAHDAAVDVVDLAAAALHPVLQDRGPGAGEHEARQGGCRAGSPRGRRSRRRRRATSRRSAGRAGPPAVPPRGPRGRSAASARASARSAPPRAWAGRRRPSSRAWWRCSPASSTLRPGRGRPPRPIPSGAAARPPPRSRPEVASHVLPTANHDRSGPECRSTTPGSNIIEEISMTQPRVRCSPTTSATSSSVMPFWTPDHQAVGCEQRLHQLGRPPRVIGLDEQQHDVERAAQRRDLAQVHDLDAVRRRALGQDDPQAVGPHRLDVRGPLLDEVTSSPAAVRSAPIDAPLAPAPITATRVISASRRCVQADTSRARVNAVKLT